MVKVFRVENSNGEGMYRSGGELEDCVFQQCLDSYPDTDISPDRVNRTLNRYIHILPEYDDSCLGWTPYPYISDTDHLRIPEHLRVKYYFAFPNVTALLEWIYLSEWRVFLDEMGFFVGVYEVDSQYFRTTKKQSVFMKECATLVEKISLLDIERVSDDVVSNL